MKVTQFVHITDVDDFIKGNYSSCFGLWDHKSGVKEWICLPESIEIEVNLDVNELREKAIAATDYEIEKLRLEMSKKMGKLIERKQQLLALTHNPEK